MPRRLTALSLLALLAIPAAPAAAPAKSPQSKRLTAAQKQTLRKRLQRELRRTPSALRSRSFLRRAALVDFELPVTIRLRSPCMSGNGLNPAPGFGQNCTTQGTALNQRMVPTARVNLGPSLGTREIALSGALAAVVEFQDTYDGGALGNVNIRLLPGDKTLRTSSVPLLWNEEIADPATRSDANWLASQARPGGALSALQSYADGASNRQGCGDWTTSAGEGGSSASAPAGPGYKALFHGAPADFGAGVGNGLPGYPVVTSSGSPSGVFLPIRPGIDSPQRIRIGALTGDNDWIGPGTDPFPSGSTPAGLDSSAANTVLRTAALSVGIAPGGVAVNMSTGTATAPGGLTTAQGSQDTTLGYSGGQANLFGNIPGKSVGVDVTVNLATKINAIARVLDQDVFKQPGVVEGERLPAAYFQCRQIFTGAVQNYIPGVRLTGSLRIAPAIMKDGRVRIAKATVQSPLTRVTRVALSACLFPAKPFNAYVPGFNDWMAPSAPTPAQVTAGGAQQAVAGGTLAVDGNASLPFVDAPRYPNLAEGISPTAVPCGSDAPGELAEVIRSGGLTQTVSGLPTPSDPAFAGVAYRGDQASVAGDLVVDPIEVDVLLGDEPIGD